MTAKNEHTGDALRTKETTENFRNNFDAIFGKKERKQYIPPPLPKN